jgi:copper(I)-binding protein
MEVQLGIFDVQNEFRRSSVTEIAFGAAATVLLLENAHLMFEGLKQPLRASETFLLSLTFKREEETGAEVQVTKAAESDGCA